MAVTPAANTNYAAPGVITPNGQANLATTAAYTSFLGVASVTEPNQATASFRYDSLPTRTAATNGHWEKTTYDGLGRPIRVEKGDGSGTKSIVDTEYVVCACSAVGKLWRVSQPYAPGGTVYWTTYSYDALGRTVSVTRPETGTTSYTYNADGTLAAKTTAKGQTTFTCDSY